MTINNTPVQTSAPVVAPNATAAAPMTLTLPNTATAGSLLVAVVNGNVLSPNWAVPVNWTIVPGVAGGGNQNVAIVYLQVQSGSNPGTSFSFYNANGTDGLSGVMFEFTGFATGTIVPDLKLEVDTSSALSATLSPGSTSVNDALVVAAIGVGGAGTMSGTAFTNSIATDFAAIDHLGVGHRVVTTKTSFSPTVASWSDTSGPHSSTFALVSFSVVQQQPVLAQPLVAVVLPTAGQIQGSLGTKPTPGNYMVAALCGWYDGWTAPAGWKVISEVGSLGLNLALAYKRVTAGDTAGPYLFTEVGGAGQEELVLMEWAGIPGTMVPELNKGNDIGPALANTVNAGTTSQNVGLVFALIGVGGTGAATAAWTNGITVDQDFLQQQFAVGHVVTAAPTSFDNTTASWTNSVQAGAGHSNTALVVVFAFVPYQAAVALVYRGYRAFAPGQTPAATIGTTVANVAAGNPSDTNTVTPGVANAEIVTFAATVGPTPGTSTPTIASGTQRLNAASTGPGFNVAVVANDALLPSSAATTWQFQGSGPYGGSAELLALSPLTAPSAPTNATATAGAQSLTATWTASADDGGSAILNYTIRATPVGQTGSPGSPQTTVSPGATNAVVTGLTTGSQYTVTVVATNAIGTSLASAASNAVTVS